MISLGGGRNWFWDLIHKIWQVLFNCMIYRMKFGMGNRADALKQLNANANMPFLTMKMPPYYLIM